MTNNSLQHMASKLKNINMTLNSFGNNSQKVHQFRYPHTSNKTTDNKSLAITT